MDAHSDVLTETAFQRKRGGHRVIEKTCLPLWKAAGINAVVCSLYVETSETPEQSLRVALDQISSLYSDIDESRGLISLCRSGSEARAAIESGKTALFLSFEGVEPLGNDIMLLRPFYELGVRFMGVTWARRNYAADGAVFDLAEAPARPGGLTHFGKKLVEHALELGMIIDVSHINVPGFYDVAEIAGHAMIASHSASYSMCGVPRNLTDDQLEKIAEADGAVGIPAYRGFISCNPKRRTPETMIEHLKHMASVAGAEHLGIGLDLCDCFPSLSIQLDASDMFKNHEEAGRIFFPMVRGAFGEKEAAGILGENFMRVIERVLG